MTFFISNLKVILLLCSVLVSFSWYEWQYETYWTDFTANSPYTEEAWRNIWNNSTNAPRPRQGHSLVIMQWEGFSYLVLFGGRDNDRSVQHIPRSYNVAVKSGTATFTTYDEKPLNPCNDMNGTYYTAQQRSHCLNSTDYTDITIGMFYNDVWAYRLCPLAKHSNQTGGHVRFFDEPCVSEGWVVWHPGAREGGCVIQLSATVCRVPSERYEHGAVGFKDGLMYVYGGYSQRCGDYCDDLWIFDVYIKNWKKLYSAGTLSKLYTEPVPHSETPYEYTQEEVPRDNSTQQWAGPGARWRHSMVIRDAYQDAQGNWFQDVAIFGGHRLWHGFSSVNSEANSWSDTSELPEGGYLNDLWIYTKALDFETVPGSDYKTAYGKWRRVRSHPAETCTSVNENTCGNPLWPSKRSGHGSAFDSKHNLIWIFGGYNSYFPYLSTDGSGSGPGDRSLGFGGFVPYPGYTYYLGDLWYYNLTDSTWKLVDAKHTADGLLYDTPSPRTGHVLLLINSESLFLHGGYADNTYLDDTWYFNISASRWLKKTLFRYPRYPANCTSDEEFIRANSSCIELSWPVHLARSQSFPYDILPYSHQSHYWPHPEDGRYVLMDKDQATNVTLQMLSGVTFSADGTPEFPYTATGVFQYAQKFSFAFNTSHSVVIVASCTSVYGEPTRGTVLDGLNGRSASSVFIAQMRRQRPGWDGCRDRVDNRSDLTPGLMYVRPLARRGHRAVYHAETMEVFMYGGVGYLGEQPVTDANTWDTTSNAELWYFNINYCINNCSYHGDCHYSTCICYPGWYGEDCSNMTCPGSACFYDQFTLQQTCYHACQSAYQHTDNDTYVEDMAKIPCSQDRPGYTHGICDGFGNSQCAPPFVGDDCSIRDCASNCSFNGWCSVEFPVSRCICNPGYFGSICESKTCLNNCSFPNGVCNTTSGMCGCRMTYNPYNSTMAYQPWAGEDCSFLYAYSSAFRNVLTLSFVTLLMCVTCALLVVMN